MPRFVVLQHETPPGYPRPSHYDLMLEWGGSLRTWALPCLLKVDAEIVAEELAPHRLAYLDFEGEIAAGRGRVTRADSGEYMTLDENENLLRIKIAGQILAGEMELVRSGDDPHEWRIILG